MGAVRLLTAAAHALRRDNELEDRQPQQSTILPPAAEVVAMTTSARMALGIISAARNLLRCQTALFSAENNQRWR